MSCPRSSADHAPSASDMLVDRLFSVAQILSLKLIHGDVITRLGVRDAMISVFGESDANGAWTMRAAFDALEIAQILWLLDEDSGSGSTIDGAAALEALRVLCARLPTQTYRSERQVALQQFSTPLPLAWLTGRAARMTPGDIVLEPSAGTGLLAVHAARAGASLVLNEIDDVRAGLLERALDTSVTRRDAEYIDNVADAARRPTVILVNPPFSRSVDRGVDRQAAARHLRSALSALAPGGRCVAIMPTTFRPTGSCAAAFASVAAVAAPRVAIDFSANPFAAHGTSVAVRMMIFDKGWAGETVEHAVGNFAGALPIVDSLPPRWGPSLDGPPDLPPSSPPVAAKAAFFGRPARAIAPPARAVVDDEIVPVDYRDRGDIAPQESPVGIYAPWRLARIEMASPRPHPDMLVESIAMASVPPPLPRNRPRLPRRSLAALSDAQCEALILAGDAFERDLDGRFVPNKAGDILVEDKDGAVYRAGFFIGDGTGVGKGREVAACIMDQWCRGQKKAVWISKSATLIEDARRDWSALGGLPIDIQPLDTFPFGKPISMASGILFLTYATLRSQRHDEASRLHQILEWLGPDHEGLIVFDEAHAMANAAGTETEFGTARGSDQGLAGVRLQNALPRARILYVSATGATDPANLCYASRLGLWGPGTSFADRGAFLAAMSAGGIAAMEIVARDLKAMGLYCARALSFAGVEYERLEHPLTPEQITVYDTYADAWALIHTNLDDALRAANIIDRATGDTLNGQALGTALSRFESAKQRFFSQLLVAMKIPSVIQAIEGEIGAGHCAVVQLVTTAEAVLDRRLAELLPEERANLDLDLSPREYMIDYLRSAFPVRQMRVVRDASGELQSELMFEADGAPVYCAAAMAARDTLVEQLCALPPIPTALDALIGHFGKERFAEVTGRSRRIVLGSRGEQVLERRSTSANLAETNAFMDGLKPILAFSDAGGTGRSYHAEKGCRSAHKRRIHFLLEPGWRAAAAIQGLGRTHRTNQQTAPIFRPVTTDCRGERRFISTIARRLDSLGALTRGQRQTGGQNLFDPADNLESDYARDALLSWYHLLAAGKLASTSLADFIDATGLKLVHKDSGMLLDKLPPIHRWLNRILALRIATQNAIFEEYLGLIQARVDAAREAGTLDVGVETILAERIDVLEDHGLRTDPRTGAEARLQRLELHLRPSVMSYDRAMRHWGSERGAVPMRNARSGQVAFCVPSWSVTDSEGRVVRMSRLVRPTHSERVTDDMMATSFWGGLDVSTFESLWNEQAAEASARLDVQIIHAVTGLLLPVWSSLPDDDVRVWRISAPSGQDVLARIVPPSTLPMLLDRFGLGDAIRLSPADLLAAARQSQGIAVPGLDGAACLDVRVNGHQRIELRNYPVDRLGWLKSLGCFTEIIQFRTRLFLPRDKAEIILQAISSNT